jgi:hypothetical protein
MPSPRALAAALAASVCTTSAHAVVSFFDGVFNNSDWTLTTLVNFPGFGSTTQGFQVLAGGNPNEYRRVRNNLIANGSNAAVHGFHMNVNAFYNPSSQGAITAINYSEDSINFIPTAQQGGNGQGTGLVILQSGRYYELRNPVLVMPYTSFSNWAPNAAPGTVATDYWEVDPIGNLLPSSNPDFSIAGGLMQFGFWRGNSGNISYSTDCGIDNWSVQIIPTPGAAAVLGLGGLLVIRRRRNS